MSIPNPNPNIADGIKSDNKTYSSNKIESLIQTDAESLTPALVADLSSVAVVNAYYREGILFVNGRLASTTGISAGGEIFTISGYNTVDTNDYYSVVGLSSTGSGSYGYTENTESGIKFSIGTAALASDNQFFFSTAIPVTKI